MQETNYFVNPLAAVPKVCALWFYFYYSKYNNTNGASGASGARAEENIFLINMFMNEGIFRD
jgi:hypothetical protein